MSWQVTGWRVAAWDTPLWITPTSRAGRYNRPNSEPTQYVCLHPWGPWAELLRWENRRTEADLDAISTRLWAVRLTLPDPPRHLDFDDSLVDDDYRACQDLADDARRSDERALVVPSAALPGTEGVVLFGAAVATPWDVAPIDDIDVPCAVLTDRCRPPAAVLPYVRHRGDPHLGLAAWRRGQPIAAPVTAPVPLPG